MIPTELKKLSMKLAVPSAEFSVEIKQGDTDLKKTESK